MIRHKAELVPVVTVFLIAMVIAEYPAFQPWLPWNADLILNGQWWRIVTGNLTHTNLNHLMLNAASFAVIAFFFRYTASWLSLLIVVPLISILIGIGLLASDMYQYAGFSGVLHGIFAFYAITETIQGRKYSSLLILGILIKVGWETWVGPSADTEALIEAKVATEAHIAGTIIGLILGSLQPKGWVKAHE
ncbi:rhombosortase [Vibrio penaeicida]|uniref:rhombosortase n=1 Tax=Vibrio penaeicida TaxID=104609 RepID=UPI002733C234|nr:rhombosortase [Vibrio penaeicida]MDP2570953.1 rhombosortase [Vibrio penaeicida]